jgi:hypothetical protein
MLFLDIMEKINAEVLNTVSVSCQYEITAIQIPRRRISFKT